MVKKQSGAEAETPAEAGEGQAPESPAAGMRVEEDDDGNLLLAGTKTRVGIDPETRQLVSVSPATLMAWKGLDRDDADKLYVRVAKAGNYFNPDAEPTDYRPDLALKGLRGERRAKVHELLGIKPQGE